MIGDNIGNIVSRQANIEPKKVSYIDAASGHRRTYQEQDNHSNQIANYLKEAGCQHNQRVLLLMRNSAEFIELIYGIAKAGAVSVPANWRLTASELAFIIDHSGSNMLFTDVEFESIIDKAVALVKRDNPQARFEIIVNRSAFSEILQTQSMTLENSPENKGDDPATIIYTSGTTGFPKGAVHTHSGIFWALYSGLSTLEYRKTDHYLAPLPMFHVGGLCPTLLTHANGATVVGMSEFDADLFLDAIEKHQVTNFTAVPTMLEMAHERLLSRQRDISSLRWGACGGAPVTKELIEMYEGVAMKVLPIYGMTETFGLSLVMPQYAAESRIGSTGKEFVIGDIRLVDESGEEVRTEQVGEIIYRGKNLMTGYWKNQQATKEAVRDGWLKTGDLAWRDEDGFYYLVDRKGSVIISGGENIYPAELERVIASHPDVVEAGVVKTPDLKWGEVPVAFIVYSTGRQKGSTIENFCRENLAGYKIPKKFYPVDALPRNVTGKLLRRELEKMAEAMA